MNSQAQPAQPWIGLPPEQFAAAFPFHLALDRNLRVIQAGSTLRRVCPDIRTGAELPQIFAAVRPEGTITKDWVLENRARFFLLRHIGTQLQLRGEFIPLPDGETLVFLGSPWFPDAAEIGIHQLTFDDFAIHDPVVDLLQVLQASKMALADAKKLASKLTEQRAELRAANERLREQEAETRKLALIAERTDNAVVLTDAEGCTVWVNEGFTRLSGYALGEILGKKPGSLLQGPGTDPETSRRMGERLRNGEGFAEQILNYAKDGRSYWVAVEVQPIRDERGRVVNFMAIESDITLRKEAETALQAEVAWRRALFEQSADGIVIVDPETGRFLEFNTAAHRELGYTREEFALLRLPDLEAQEPGGPAAARVAEGIKEGRLEYETVHLGKLGGIKNVHVTAQALRGLGQTVCQYVWRDITASRAARQRLAIQSAVSRVLVESNNLATAVPRLLQSVCENLGWQVGLVWRLAGDRLRFFEVWHPASAGVPDFVAASRPMEFGRGSGLPGRVWATGKPVWISDSMLDGSFPRNAFAAKHGLRSGFAFAVPVRGGLWGVAEFFGRGIENPDEALLQTFAALGNHLGQFIARREVEEELRKANTLQRAILEAANYAIISTSTDGVIRTFNSTAERMLGYSAGEVVDKLTPAVLHDPAEVAARAAELGEELGRTVEPGFEAFVAKAALGKTEEREWTYIRKDGGRFPVLLFVTALFDERGKVSGYLGVASDMTERNRAAGELLRAKEAAEAANRAKSDFLAMMSHEIRTPMNAVLGMANLLLETPLDEKQREFARTVARSGEALIEIIDDILDFSKIEAGEHFQLENDVFSLRALIDDVVQLLRPRAGVGRITLTGEISPSIPGALLGDSGRLRQVIVNLVGNGLKFTDRGSVSIRVDCLKAEEGRVLVRFEVRDTGIGIQPRDLDRLFQPFTQAERRGSRPRGGTGLGLAISKRIVQLMGGNIGAESVPGQGSLFWFELSLDLASAAVPSTAGPEAGSGAESFTPPVGPPTRILVAEDHETNRRLAMLALDKLGFRADFACNGLEAVEAWDRFGHDVILMDCQMPEMDGFEATREIRRREAARPLDHPKRVRVLALTANAIKGDRERCLAAGMDGYISKPFTLKQLREALEQGGARPERPPGTPAPPAPPPSEFDPSRPDLLLSELGGEDVSMIVRDFARDLPGQATELRALAAEGRMIELGRLAHSLQGIGRSLGLDGFGARLLALEKAAGSLDEPAVAEFMASLDPGVERSIAHLESWLASRGC